MSETYRMMGYSHNYMEGVFNPKLKPWPKPRANAGDMVVGVTKWPRVRDSISILHGKQVWGDRINIYGERGLVLDVVDSTLESGVGNGRKYWMHVLFPCGAYWFTETCVLPYSDKVFNTLQEDQARTREYLRSQGY